MALKQNLSVKLEQRLSPQQIQLMKLLEVPTMELEMRIKQEIEENPALEEGAEKDENELSEEEEYNDDTADSEEEEFDISDYLDDDADYKTQVSNKGKDDDDKVIPLSGDQSFQERMVGQLQLLSLNDHETVIAITIIGNLDDSGYLNREVEAIVDDLAFSSNVMTTEEEVEKILQQIQELDPAGVGARDLRECLLLQINRKQDGDITKFTAKKILEDHFEEFTKKHYTKILKKLEISDEDLKEAIEEIVKLNPKPGGSMKEAAGNYQQIIPDFAIIENEGRLQVTINGRNAPELKVSKTYRNMLKAYSEGAKSTKADKEALTFVKQKLDGAKWFIDAIKQRQNTLLLTMQAIMEYQREYFLTGDETKLKPMILKDIAEKVNLDISTISRVANSKHVQTGQGIFSLKYFFSESLSTDSGEEVSTREVKKILSEAIENEEKRKPLTDEKLANLLKEKGYNIARRTVAKYREQLNIPVARLRKGALMRVLSEFISWLFMPLFMPMYALALVLFVPSNQDYFYNDDCLYLFPEEAKWALLYVFFILVVAAPGLSFIGLQRARIIDTIEMETQRERSVPIVLMLLFCLTLYFFFYAKVGANGTSKFVMALPLSGAAVIGVFFFLNRWKKVSIHAAGAGILTGFILAYIVQHVEYELWMFIVTIIVSGLVMSARLYLQKHTLLELVIGWFTGTLITFAINYFY